MPWVLDGNNLARGGERGDVRRAALALARRERVRIVLFFDGAPPPGGPAREHLGSVEVRYTPSADSAILEFFGGEGRGFRLATDDRDLSRRAKAAGAEVVDARTFWRKVGEVEGGGGRGGSRPGAEPLSGYPSGVERLPERPGRVPRRHRNRHRR